MRHPYLEFETDPLWPVVSDAIRDLVKNRDVREETAREYIVGYVVKKVREAERSGPAFVLSGRHSAWSTTIQQAGSGGPAVLAQRSLLR